MIEKSQLTEVVEEQRQRLLKMPAGIRREQLDTVKEYAVLPHVVIISGLRRTGKSTLLRQAIEELSPEPWYYLNFDSERLASFELTDFNTLYEVFIGLYGAGGVFFLDEIQNIEGWERFVRRMNDDGFKLYITGSNASLLSRELGTHLTGRQLPISLYPFSFREYLKVKNAERFLTGRLLTEERGAVTGHFRRYIELGGLPQYLLDINPAIPEQIYKDVIFRDVVARYDIEEDAVIRELGVFLMSNPGAYVTYAGLQKTLGTGSANTIKAYIRHLQDSYLIMVLSKFSFSVKAQQRAPKKIYPMDNGMASAVGFSSSPDRGRKLEQVIALELHRRLQTGQSLYYYETKNGLEIDFLIRQGTEAVGLIQVSWSLADKATRQREIKALVKAMDEVHLVEGLILTDDEEEIVKEGGKTITVMPVWQWLLESADV